MEKKRICYFDNAKFFLILFVVIGHCANRYIQAYVFREMYIFIYAFHMPLFIFLSGLFHRNKNIKERIFSFVSIGVLMNILTFAVARITTGRGKLTYYSASGAPWFMFGLAGFTLIVYLCRNVNPKLLLTMSFVIGAFSGYVGALGDKLALSRICVFLPFYVLGTMCQPEKIIELSQKKWATATGWGLFVIWGVCVTFLFKKIYFLRPFFTARAPFNKAVVFPLQYRLLCYAISLLLVFAFLAIIPHRQLPIISVGGARTMQIYFWHVPILNIFYYLGTIKWMCYPIWGRYIYIALAVGLTVLLSTKFFSFPTKQILKYGIPKKNKE